jgi:uncharacterized ferritin-like protein (DUF455 family)
MQGGYTGAASVYVHDVMAVHTVREFCMGLLESEQLSDKLAPPPQLLDDEPGPALVLDAPSRQSGLTMRSGSERLPKLHELKDPAARAFCLERFAHHELCAVELFAWALLAFPALPRPLRRGLLQTLAEEQTHLALYLERLAAMGSGLGERPPSDYLWRQVPAVLASPAPERAFLAAMGLTFEQANLDFSALYAEAFAKAGDEEGAAVLTRVHDDEIGHVALAARWLVRLDEGAATDLEAYERAVPFPLSAYRAKGRRFDEEGRRRAGLSDELIHHVRDARPSHQSKA